MKNFDGFSLSPDLNKSLAKMGYTKPTPIQEKAIPLALQGRDVLGSAQTGTGKTAAFSVPLVEHIMNSEHGCALVLTPTRELAKQVLEVIHQLLGLNSGINTAFIIGGDSMDKQLRQLKNNPRIIVGTPGRVNDHLDRKTIKLHNTAFLVLDETDRMLDMGFGVQLDRIAAFLPNKRQTLMFSATLPKGIVQISAKYLTNPERISVGATNVIAPKIKQEVIKVEQGAKYKVLVDQLYDRTGSVIIFVKTKYGTERLAKNLKRDGFEADCLHGDMRQRNRDKVMRNFREKKFRILVATDIAARGLDVPHIEHVINHDLPQVAEDYIHRMGRTARAGAEGSALSLVSGQESRQWRDIECLLDPSKKSSSSSSDKRGNSKRRKPDAFKGKYAGKGRGGDRGGKFGNRSSSSRDGGKFAKRDGGKPAWKKREGGQSNDRDDRNEGKRNDSRGGSQSRDGGKPSWKKREGGQSNDRDDRYEGKRNDSRGDSQSRDGGKPSWKKREGQSNDRNDRYEGKHNDSRGGSQSRDGGKPSWKKREGGQSNDRNDRYEGKRNDSRGGSQSRDGGKPSWKKREGSQSNDRNDRNEGKGQKSEGGRNDSRSDKPRNAKPVSRDGKPSWGRGDKPRGKSTGAAGGRKGKPMNRGGFKGNAGSRGGNKPMGRKSA